MSTFDEVAEKQGWNADSRETVLKSYIDSDMSLDLGTFAQNVADVENGVPEGSSSKRVPDLVRDLTGEYTGNAYPETAEYRMTMTVLDTGEDYGLVVEDTSGHVVGSMTLSDDEADGVIRMSSTDHGLGAYEDDWKIPAGMMRQLSWVLQTNLDVSVTLDEFRIDEVATWLKYATGEDEWDWAEQGSEWEY